MEGEGEGSKGGYGRMAGGGGWGFFVGGVSYAEIAVLRFLSQQEDSEWGRVQGL